MKNKPPTSKEPDKFEVGRIIGVPILGTALLVGLLLAFAAWLSR